MLYSSERPFQIWDFNVSHSQLLLRSPGSAGSGKNIDVIFLGVDFLGLPSILEGLTLDRASPEEAAKVIKSLARGGESCDVWSIRSEGRLYHVAAVALYVCENALDLFDSSLEYASDPIHVNKSGKLLVGAHKNQDGKERLDYSENKEVYKYGF